MDQNVPVHTDIHLQWSNQQAAEKMKQDLERYFLIYGILPGNEKFEEFYVKFLIARDAWITVSAYFPQTTYFNEKSENIERLFDELFISIKGITLRSQAFEKRNTTG